MRDADSIQTPLPRHQNEEQRLAWAHLRQAYPYLTGLFDAVGEVGPDQSPSPCISEAVVRIIAGQMLSGTAARTIYGRLSEMADARGLAATHMLAEEDIRKCGLSGRKAQAIRQFSDLFVANPARFHGWKSLGYDQLAKDVSSLWGLSQWSASIIALSHFKMPDVWPHADGSIQRALLMLSRTYEFEFNPDLGTPYRSYLARALWAGLDSGQLAKLGA